MCSLIGTPLSSISTDARAFADPFPSEGWPQKEASERRYFYYSEIARYLGIHGHGNRYQLPECATK